jgi:hypothetical protein
VSQTFSQYLDTYSHWCNCDISTIIGGDVKITRKLKVRMEIKLMLFTFTKFTLGLLLLII